MRHEVDKINERSNESVVLDHSKGEVILHQSQWEEITTMYNESDTVTDQFNMFKSDHYYTGNCESCGDDTDLDRLDDYYQVADDVHGYVEYSHQGFYCDTCYDAWYDNLKSEDELAEDLARARGN